MEEPGGCSPGRPVPWAATWHRPAPWCCCPLASDQMHYWSLLSAPGFLLHQTEEQPPLQQTCQGMPLYSPGHSHLWRHRVRQTLIHSPGEPCPLQPRPGRGGEAVCSRFFYNKTLPFLGQAPQRAQQLPHRHLERPPNLHKSAALGESLGGRNGHTDWPGS